jgi:hypothetical protein
MGREGGAHPRAKQVEKLIMSLVLAALAEPLELLELHLDLELILNKVTLLN